MPGLKACLTCGALSKKSYCPEHTRRPYYTKASGPRQPNRKRASATERGYDAAYQRLKRRFREYWIATYGMTCAGWQRPPHPVDALTVDHVVPLSKGGLSVWDNLQCLCLPCNSAKRNKT